MNFDTMTSFFFNFFIIFPTSLLQKLYHLTVTPFVCIPSKKLAAFTGRYSFPPFHQFSSISLSYRISFFLFLKEDCFKIHIWRTRQPRTIVLLAFNLSYALPFITAFSLTFILSCFQELRYLSLS